MWWTGDDDDAILNLKSDEHDDVLDEGTLSEDAEMYIGYSGFK